MSRSLRELDGELTTINYGEGIVLSAVIFVCPTCANRHSHLIPFSDEPFHEVQGKIKVWQRVKGSTIDDITLTPSYLVVSCGCFHGYVRDGQWVEC